MGDVANQEPSIKQFRSLMEGGQLLKNLALAAPDDVR